MAMAVRSERVSLRIDPVSKRALERAASYTGSGARDAALRSVRWNKRGVRARNQP